MTIRHWLCRAASTALAGLAATALSGPVQAAPLGWVLNTNQTLDLVDLATNAGGTVNNTGFASDSLAVSPVGTLFAADPLGNLWNVNGPPIPVGPTGRTQIGDLDWAPGGLWGYSNASGELFFFDLGSATVTVAVTLTLPASLSPTAVVTGLAHQPTSGDIFLSVSDGLNNDQLLRVPAASSTALLVGTLLHGDGFSFISDIDFDAGGSLVAMTWFHRWFYDVSTTTAATSFISSGPHRDTTGLALLPAAVPVPEPAPAWLLGLAMLLGLVGRLQRPSASRAGASGRLALGPQARAGA